MNSGEMKESFSIRNGYRFKNSTPQLEFIDSELLNSLWDIFYITLFHGDQSIVANSQYSTTPLEDLGKPARSFFIDFWLDIYKHLLDEMPLDAPYMYRVLRKFFFDPNTKWFVIYDLVELLLESFLKDPSGLQVTEMFNKALEKKYAGYRIIEGLVSPITDEQELESIEHALDTPLSGVHTHLSSALEFLSDRNNPNFRNSIKESISAVECICRTISHDDNATLGAALSILEREHNLHPALKRGYSALYGYTNDEGGIRHSLMDDNPNVDFSDAYYFLISCSSFINYLKMKLGDRLTNTE